MEKGLKVNIDKQEIVMSGIFAKKSRTFGTREYYILQKCRKDYPEYDVVQRHIAKNKNKKIYKGLTYDYMRDYIMYKEPEDTVDNVIDEFEEMIILSKCHSQAFRYPIIKKWFLDRYPEIKNFGLSDMDAFKIEKTPVVSVNESDISDLAA